jgi:acetylornithine deacetylase
MPTMALNVIDLLAELVSINSANASMGAGGSHGSGERELAQRVAELGHDMGAQVSLDEALPGRPNVLVTLPPTGAGTGSPRRLLFDVHLDTVPLEPMPSALTPRIGGGRMWGRGACDTKSSLAAALVALQRLAAVPLRTAEVCLIGTVDEEYLKTGIAHAVAGGLTADAAIVGEPTDLKPVIAHKGAVRWRLTTVGKAAHTSRPENGNNAIYQMVEVIRVLRERLEPRLAAEVHPLLSPPTLTVGSIQGGVGVNIVPDSCTIAIDRRTLPREDPDGILAEVDSLLAELMAAREDVKVEREAPFLSERGLETPPDAPLVRALQGACRAVLGERADVAPSGVPYGTDGTHLTVARIPAVVFGPGNIAQAHTADEWVELAQVEQAADIYYRLMHDFVAGDWARGTL